MAKLLLIDSGKIQEIQMGQEITIGRAYSNLLRLEGEEISRVHAIVYRRGTDYVVRDLDSKNGVVLNGEKVTNTVVAPGDHIQIGKYSLIFDPPPDFDMTGFFRSNNIRPPSDPTPIKLKDDETSEGPDSSLDKVTRVPDNVFFDLVLVEKMASPGGLPQSPQLLGEILKLHSDVAGLSEGHTTPTETGIYESFIAAIVGAIGADRGVIILKDDAGEVLRLGAIVPRDKDVSVNRVVLRNVLREHKAVFCNDTCNNDSFQKTETVKKDKIGSLISYPLMRGGEAVGLIYADTIERPDAFRADQLVLLQIASRMLVACVRKPDVPA